MTELKQVENSILDQAKAEIAKEEVKRAVSLYKAKLKERNAAKTVLDNIDREIADLELKIEQGNF
jgi:hypothetical protein